MAREHARKGTSQDRPECRIRHEGGLFKVRRATEGSAPARAGIEPAAVPASTSGAVQVVSQERSRQQTADQPEGEAAGKPVPPDEPAAPDPELLGSVPPDLETTPPDLPAAPDLADFPADVKPVNLATEGEGESAPLPKKAAGE